MTTVEEYLINARNIMTLALAGKTDEQISDETGFKLSSVTHIRAGLGFKKVRRSMRSTSALLTDNSSSVLGFAHKVAPAHKVEVIIYSN